MIITQTDLAKLRIQQNAAMTKPDILADLIKKHKEDPARIKAIDGERYYKGEHDIKKHSFNETTILKPNPSNPAEDVEEEFTNPNGSNVRQQHKFLFNHIEQKVAYISRKEPSVTVDGAEHGEDGSTGNEQWQYQNELVKTTSSKFLKILLRWLRKASQHGVAWLHEYKDKSGKLKQVVVTRLEGIPIYDTVHEQELVEFIRWYTVDFYTGEEYKQIIKAEWWTATDVTYYIQDATTGRFHLDSDYEINPAPHYWEVTTTTAIDGVTVVETGRKPKSWGRVPFVELANNDDKLTDLEVYKDLIDAYDLIASKGTNNLMDFNEFYAAIIGFGGDAASAIAKKLLVNRVVSVTANGGSVDMKQLDMQMTGRIDWLKELWKAIHVFGQAVDVTNDNLGNAPSGVSLKFQYTLLDLKADNLIIQAENALVEHFGFVTEEINRKTKTKYDPELVQVSFNKAPITNDLETVQMIAQSDNIVPERMLLAAHPLVDDIDEAYKQLLEQRQQRIEQQQAFMSDYGQPPENEEEDGADE